MIELTISNEEFMGLFRRLAAYVANKHPEWVSPEVGDLLESAPDGTVIVNADGRIVVVNSQTEILFGYSRQELIGQPVELLIPARLEHLHTKHRASFLAEPHVRPMGAGLELFGKRKNGMEFPLKSVSARCGPHKDSSSPAPFATSVSASARRNRSKN
jgi:PAS domain S-box-containing protein